MTLKTIDVKRLGMFVYVQMPKSTSVRLRLADTADTAPKWHLLFPLGATKHRADFPKPITFDSAFLQSMVANYASEDKPERAVNFFHQGASDVPAPIDNKVAAGWIVDVKFESDGFQAGMGDGPGLYALIQWTDRARTYILKDELRYLSPEFVTASTNKDTGLPSGPKLLGAALLNDPFLTELPRVAASEKAGDDMNRKMVCQALGCPESATDEEINAACKKMAEANAQAKKDEEAKAEAAKADAAKKEEEDAKAEEMKAKKAAESEAQALALAEAEKQKVSMAERLALLEKAHATLLAEKKASEVKSFFDGLVKEGRCTPALRTGLEELANKHGLDAVRFMEKAAPVVPMGEVGVAGRVDADAATASSDAEKRINARLEELKAKGIKLGEALGLARSEMAEDFKVAYGTTPLAKHLESKGVKS